MYSLGFVCLLSAAVALPTPEQLRTNFPALLPPPEYKSEETDINSNVHDPNSPLLDKAESVEAKNQLESAEKPKVEKDEDKDKLDDDFKVMQKESKESEESKYSKETSKESTDSKESKKSIDSKESKYSKEKSNESKESKESQEPWEYNKVIEERPEVQKEGKKEKYSKSEDSKERDEEKGPIIVQVMKKPGQKGFISNWLPSIPNFHLPRPLTHFASKFRNGGQHPVYYIVRESDFAFDDY